MAVEVQVRTQLTKIVEDLEKIQRQASTLSSQMKDAGADVGKSVENQTKSVSNAFSALRDFGRRTADQLRKDFMSLGSVASLTAGLKLGEQFSGSIKEAVNLSDTVRRLGGVFGIAERDFGTFQAKLQDGLGLIGASGEAAANALKGLAETPVRGQANLLAYAKTAAELASISGEKGQEGAIAKGAAGIITARGGNPNDLTQLDAVSKEILQIRQATSKSVTDITQTLQGLYANTNKQFQGRLAGGGSTTLASAALMGGPEATSFVENFLGKNKFQRMGQEAQGFGNILGKNGELNSSAIAGIISEAKGRGLGDTQAGLTTMGLSDEEAKGFIRLADALKMNGTAIQGAHKQVVDLTKTYQETMSMGDSFRASINRVKSTFATPLSWVTQHLTSGLQGASQSTGGALAVTGGAAVLAAMLTGGGLRGIGKSLFGMGADEAKKSAIEAATGEKVQRVEVINWPSSLGDKDTGMAGLVKSWLEKSGGLMGSEGIAGGIEEAAVVAAGVGVGVGTAVVGGAGAGILATKYNADHGIDVAHPAAPGTAGGAMVDGKSFDFKMFLDGLKDVFHSQPRVHVDVSSKTRDLRATPLPGRTNQ